MEELAAEPGFWRVFLWWEARRIPYNLTLLVVGGAAVMGSLWLLSPLVPPGEDVIEPMAMYPAILLYGIAANVCYTFGWISEGCLWRAGIINSLSTRRRIFLFGFAGSSLLTSLPLWGSLTIRALYALRHR